MGRFCSNCGKEVNQEAVICVGCGCSLNNVPRNLDSVPEKVKVEGNGSSIASMVLGIIAVCWAGLELLSMEDLAISIPTGTVAELIGFFIGYNLLSLPTGIISLSLGLSSKAKNKKRMAGIITSGIALVIVAISLIIMVVNFV